MSLFEDIRDEDVYDYRRYKEVQQRSYCVEIRKNDTSIKRSVRTSIGYIDLYFYYPEHSRRDAVLFNFHGGGMCLGYWELDAPYCRRLANATGAVVINVDYVVGPEYKFPLSYSTAHEIYRWCLTHAAELDISGTRVFVGGSSAGAGVAAALVQLAAQCDDRRICGLYMNYPCVMQRLEERRPSNPEKAISPHRFRQYLAWEFDRVEDIRNPLASPLLSDPCAYSDVLINAAEYDALLDDEIAFANKLQGGGVNVDFKCYQGCMHGFTHRDLKEYERTASEDAWNRIARWVVARSHEKEIEG